MRRLIGNKPVSTVLELKEILNQIPDNYTLTCMGTEFAIVVDDTDKFILMDEADYIEEMLQEEE